MADFFSLIDADGIVESHAQSVFNLSEKEARAMLRRYREVRQELADRLARARGDSFTAQKLRGVMVQVESGIQAMTEALQSGMKETAPIFANRGIQDQLKEIRRWDSKFTGAVTPINVDAVAVATDTSNFLLNQHDASLEAYGQGLISQITSNLTNSVLLEDSLSEVVQKLSLFFQGEEWKLLRIARTELMNVYGLGKLRGMQRVADDTLPDLQKTLYHPMDARTSDDSKYVAKLNLIVDLDKPFRYTYKGKERVFMAPPDRPNDRSILIPYRQAWAQ